MKPLQRGNPDIMKSIQKKAQKISESRGVSSGVINTNNIEMPRQEAGAFSSIQRMNSNNSPNRVHSTLSESFYEKKLVERLLESVETLESTKEYFNAASSLFTLYAMGSLTEGVMNSISRSDLREIKGIIREFKEVIDSY